MLKTLKILLFAAAYIPLLPAQNLLKNGSFEEHRPLDCLTCHLEAANFEATLPGWQSLNTQVFICDVDYKKNTGETNGGACRFDKIQPRDGHTVMELEYMPARLDWAHETRGGGSHLAARLAAPLQTGCVYAVSFWLNILTPETPGYAQHIGFTLFPDAVRNPQGKMLDGSIFLIDTVVYDTWYRVKWYVRPLCPLQYLVLGVFRDEKGPPVNQTHQRNRFYIDQVDVEKIPDTGQAAARAIAFCRDKKREAAVLPEAIEGVTCYFSFSDSLPGRGAESALDSFAQRAKQQPLSAFFISGHTDSIGTGHLALSAARIEAVLGYLEEKHRIPRLRFIAQPWGNSKPAATNATESGRQLNRRVEIRQVDCGAAAAIYRNLLLLVFEGNKEAAFKALQVWLQVTEDRHKLLLIFDPRMEPLKADPRWSEIQKRVHAQYRHYERRELAFTLDSLWAEDQKTRTLGYYIENLAAYWLETDSIDPRWDVRFPKEPDAVQSEADKQHFKVLAGLLHQYGWPEISKVGERAAKAAFLIVNHMLDTSVLALYLPVVHQRCLAGEAEWLWYATMYDRFMTLKGLPQRYGTQYHVLDNTKGHVELYPLEDKEKVNQWRKELGLNPLEAER